MKLVRHMVKQLSSPYLKTNIKIIMFKIPRYIIVKRILRLWGFSDCFLYWLVFIIKKRYSRFCGPGYMFSLAVIGVVQFKKYKNGN